MHFKSRTPCARVDQGVNGIKISLQVVKLAAYCSFYLPVAWLLLFGDIKESSTCPAKIISRLVFS
jgi:hypothetical protein